MSTLEDIRIHGFSIVPQATEPAKTSELLDLLGSVSGAGRRGLLSVPAIREFACSEHLLGLIRPHVPAEPFPMRAIYFDKTPGKNWLVTWH